MTQSSDYQSYEEAKARLDQIVSDVRGKDISLETSLELLEEGVALANKCTELIDVASWSVPSEDDETTDFASGDSLGDTAPSATPEITAVDSTEKTEDVAGGPSDTEDA
jgi:exodeoxyribonuclease VII small subunit